MTGCLGERALFRVSEGDATAAEQAHLSACPRCGAALRDLDAAVALAARVLREGPLPTVAPRRLSMWSAGLLPLAATLVLAVGVTWWTTARTLVPTRPVQLASLSLTELSHALGAGDGSESDTTPDSDVAYLQAALSGQWPCEGYEAPLDPRCD